jgi:hypothetical protein
MPGAAELPGYADAMRLAAAMQEVHTEGFASGQTPSVVEGDEGVATLEWLGAERLNEEGA